MADFDDDVTPPTLPAGALEPPRRRPPTAVGTAAPDPQPSHDSPRASVPLDAYRPHGVGAPVMRRRARQLLAMLVATLALGAAWPLGWRGRIAVGLVALAAHLWRLAGRAPEAKALRARRAADDHAA